MNETTTAETSTGLKVWVSPELHELNAADAQQQTSINTDGQGDLHRS